MLGLLGVHLSTQKKENKEKKDFANLVAAVPQPGGGGKRALAEGRAPAMASAPARPLRSEFPLRSIEHARGVRRIGKISD